MNKQQMLTNAKRVIDDRRYAAEEQVAQTLESLRSDKSWTDNEYALRSAQIDLAMGNDDSEKLQKEIARLEDVQKKLLSESGIAESALTPHYFCAKCNDVGYVNGKICSCLQEELRKQIIAQSNVIDPRFTFQNSTETDKHNKAVYKKAQELCVSGKGNMLLTGNVGCGKTYLLTACANLCADLGRSALFVTAYSLNRSFLEAHLSDLAGKDAILDALVDVDLLLIDDLGTENVYRNVTAEYLFSVLNERLSRQKQTFITTNLGIADIRERYDERIFSRLVDQNATFVAMLTGKDKRLAK